MRKLELLNEERAAIWKTLNGMERTVRLIKASGGYKDREPLGLTDREFDEQLQKAFGHLKVAAIFLPIAESMIEEYGHQGEYHDRKLHAFREIDEENRRKTKRRK